MMMEPLILCENLVKIYSLQGIEVVALQGLDLAVQTGEIVGIVGASGSGKTTLLNVLGGLDRPSAGKVLVGGRDLLKFSGAELDVYRRTRVGFVWQQATRNLIPYLTAFENVELPMRLTRRSRRERGERARALLEVLGLASRLAHLPRELSGGEQQRVAIAVALANQPQILLADEPTGEVDSLTAQDIYAALRKTNETYGTTVLVVSHDPNLSHHTGRVVAIRDGKTSTEVVRTVSASTRMAQTETVQDEAALDARQPATIAPRRLAPREAQPKPSEFEEWVVLDNAGRLQVPRHYLEALNIGDRVRLELENGRLVICPIAGHGRMPGRQDALPVPEELYVAQQDDAPEPKRSSLNVRPRHIIERIQSLFRPRSRGAGS